MNERSPVLLNSYKRKHLLDSNAPADKLTRVGVDRRQFETDETHAFRTTLELILDARYFQQLHFLKQSHNPQQSLTSLQQDAMRCVLP